MNRRIAAHVSLGLAAIVGMATTARSEPQDKPPGGAVALFDGESLAGWHGLPAMDLRKLDALNDEERSRKVAEWTREAKEHWRADGGELVGDGREPHLASDKEYGDIELRLDCMDAPLTEAGIMIRGRVHPLFVKFAGNRTRPTRRWRHVRILQVGARTTFEVDGELLSDHEAPAGAWDRTSPPVARGPIELMADRGEVRWRNIVAREIPPDEANKILAGHDSAGFRSLFDGKGLDAWAGPVDNYEVVDGAIRCKPGKGGTIYTRQEYSDFVARVEFRLPPGGNNGLAIRYPGEGDTSVTGMCELQVLDDGAEKYARLDSRQYHGSAYGMVPARRGYLRPVGEWNFEEVTVAGSRIKVELNGTVILDADLGRVTEFMGNKSHPGKDRTSGFFGFAGHNDPVEFRNVAIRPIPRARPTPDGAGRS